MLQVYSVAVSKQVIQWQMLGWLLMQQPQQGDQEGSGVCWVPECELGQEKSTSMRLHWWHRPCHSQYPWSSSGPCVRWEKLFSLWLCDPGYLSSCCGGPIQRYGEMLSIFLLCYVASVWVKFNFPMSVKQPLHQSQPWFPLCNKQWASVECRTSLHARVHHHNMNHKSMVHTVHLCYRTIVHNI